MALIFGTDHVVDSGCREDCSHANGTGDELSLLAGNGTQDSGIESGHEVGKEDRGRACGFISILEDWMNVYPCVTGCAEEGY